MLHLTRFFKLGFKSEKKPILEIAVLPFFSCLKPLEDKVIGETVNSRLLVFFHLSVFLIFTRGQIEAICPTLKS